MDIRFLITSLLLAVAWASEAAVPQLTDFNTNQFGTSGGIVTIKNGALVTNLVGAGSGSVDWTNTAWGLQPVATNNLVDIHHGTNAIWVNQLATGGNGTTNNPWTGLTSSSLTNSRTQYYWPSGYYKITNTLDLLGYETFHIGENATVIKFAGEGVAIRFADWTNWTIGAGFENFRIDCQDAILISHVPFSITMAGSVPALATVTLTNHGYSTGDLIDIRGANQGDYNGTRCITVTDANHFTYAMRSVSSAASPATGTLSVRKASVALQMIGVRNQYCKNLVLANCSLGINLQACVSGTWDNTRITHWEEPGGVWAVRPITGLLTGVRMNPYKVSTIDFTTTQVFNSLIVEGIEDYGVVLMQADEMLFYGGTSEGNGSGVLIAEIGGSAATRNNVFVGFDTEANSSGMDMLIQANGNSVQQMVPLGSTYIQTGQANSIIDGYSGGVIQIGATAFNTLIQGVAVGKPTNILDQGIGTTIQSCVGTLGTLPTSYTGAWYLKPRLIPSGTGGIISGGTLAIDCSLASAFETTYTTNFTVGNPTNPSDGQDIHLRMKHTSGTTNFTVSLDTKWNLPSWIATPTFDISNGISYLDARYDSTRDLWDIYRWIDVSSGLRQGTTNTVYHGSATGNPTFASVTEYDLGLTDTTLANVSTNLHGFAPKGETNDQKYLQATGIWAVPTGTGVGANASEPYVTIGSVGSLSDERALTSGQVSITDNGAGSTVTIGATTDTPQFTRLGLGSAVDGFASLVTTSSIKGADGSATAPTYTFGSETNLGLYRTAGYMNVTIGGARKYFFNQFLMGFDPGITLAWHTAGFALADTLLSRDSAATLQMGADVASPVTQKFKAGDGTGADKAGSSLILAGGSGTGIGQGGDLITQTTISSNASGSTLQLYSTRHYESAKPSSMTNSTANPVFNILIGSTHYFGCKIFATTFAADAGGDFQALSEELMISAVNKGGTISNTVSASWGSTLAASVASTLTTTWTAVTSGASLDIKCTPVSSLTPTTYYTKWKVDVLSNDPATIAPYR